MPSVFRQLYSCSNMNGEVRIKNQPSRICIETAAADFYSLMSVWGNNVSLLHTDTHHTTDSHMCTAVFARTL